jgi:hypothetical protein
MRVEKPIRPTNTVASSESTTRAGNAACDTIMISMLNHSIRLWPAQTPSHADTLHSRGCLLASSAGMLGDASPIGFSCRSYVVQHCAPLRKIYRTKAILFALALVRRFESALADVPYPGSKTAIPCASAQAYEQVTSPVVDSAIPEGMEDIVTSCTPQERICHAIATY